MVSEQAPVIAVDEFVDAVKVFERGDERYLYVPYTNEFFSIPENLEVTEEVVQEILATHSQVVDAQSEGSLEFDFGYNDVFESYDIESLMQSNQSTVIIGVTHQCSLRCSYCVYDPKYSERRDHEEVSITLDTVEKSIDSLEARSSSDDATILFYGGEPLTNFESIRHGVEYANETLSGSPSFSMISNGVALARDTFAFLHRHDFDIVVSLDGPKEVHDRNRELCGGGGSFDVIMGNLERAKEEFPEYYTESITFMPTLNPPYELLSVDEFFSRHPLARENDLAINWVTTGEGIPRDGKFEGAEIEALKERYIDALADRSPDTCKLGDAMLGPKLRKVAQRNMEPVSGQMHPHAMCVPGVSKTFVDTDGTRYMCQRVDDVPLGDIGDDTLDPDASEAVLREYTEALTLECSSCWASRFCDACYPKFFVDGEFLEERQQNNCDHVRDSYTHAIEVFFEAQERGLLDSSLLQQLGVQVDGDRDPNAF